MRWWLEWARLSPVRIVRRSILHLSVRWRSRSESLGVVLGPGPLRQALLRVMERPPEAVERGAVGRIAEKVRAKRLGQVAARLLEEQVAAASWQQHGGASRLVRSRGVR